MKSHIAAGLRPIHLYTPGDLLLESERIAATGPVILHVLGGGQSKPEEPAKDIIDIAKPKPDDFPALKAALQVFKFKEESVVKYHQILGTAINIASSVVWVVGAYFTIASVLKELFGDEVDETKQRLKHISERVDQIYGYLAQAERKGLFNEAIAWRENLDVSRNAINNARISRSPENLESLVNRAAQLDTDLGTMLTPMKADISFLRAVYGYTPHPQTHYGVHWIDACASPFMSLADGTPLNYRDPTFELQSSIWDPGHYIDVLLNSLIDRLLLLATTEPAFRSTYYDRVALENLLTGLTDFINKWRASLIVAHPLVGLNGGGALLHPEMSAPPGIALGAVEPVTGVAFYISFWADFTYQEIWRGSAKAKGKPDETRAKDPALAFARALDLQAKLFDAVVRVSGIGRLVELRARIQDLLTRSSIGSDFVDLPNATFSLLDMTGPAAQIEQVDLGFIGRFSKNRNKKYLGRRYTQTFEKRFRFAMALRTDVSHIQLGYRIELGGHSVPLIPYSVAPGFGTAPRFPTQPISLEIRGDEWTVYDVYQSVIFRPVDEDEFEGGASPVSASKYVIAPIRLVPAERLFLNERKGPVALKVDIAFDADLNSPEQPFVGHATVTIRNLDPARFRDGVILPVTVFETRVVDKNGQTQEFIADRMTIHLVPSFLVVGQEYFTDRREGLEAIDTIFGGINDRYAISEQQLVPVGPEWQVRRRVFEETVKIKAIQQFAEQEPAVAEQALRRFQLPALRRQE